MLSKFSIATFFFLFYFFGFSGLSEWFGDQIIVYSKTKYTKRRPYLNPLHLFCFHYVHRCPRYQMLYLVSVKWLSKIGVWLYWTKKKLRTSYLINKYFNGFVMLICIRNCLNVSSLNTYFFWFFWIIRIILRPKNCTLHN